MTTPAGTPAHEYCCSLCGFAFDWDTCTFTGYGDCTADSHCIICYQPNPVSYEDHEYGAWKDASFSSYHYRVCTHKDCFVEQTAPHNQNGTFGEVGGPYYPQYTDCGKVFYD